MPSADIHRLLDRHLDVLTEMGSPVGSDFASAPAEEDVRAALRQARYHDRDDVVALFTWRGHRQLGDPERSGAFVFEETAFLVDFEEAIWLHKSSARDRHRSLRDETPPGSVVQTMFPGPDFFLPFAVLDGVEWLSIDCRPDPVGGAVVFCGLDGGEPSVLFESLADALAAATYCLETGFWEVGQRGRIEKAHGVVGAPDRVPHVAWIFEERGGWRHHLVGSPSTPQQLQQLVLDKSASDFVRSTAAGELREASGDLAAQTLCEVATSVQESAFLRRNAIGELRWIEGLNVAETLCALARNHETAVAIRKHALTSLRTRTDTVVVDVLCELATDGEEADDLRKAAIVEMRWAGSRDRFAETCRAIITDANVTDSLRSGAVAAMSSFGGDLAVETLCAVVADTGTSEDLRRDAIVKLSNMSQSMAIIIEAASGVKDELFNRSETDPDKLVAQARRQLQIGVPWPNM